jgi:hypothetical protein
MKNREMGDAPISAKELLGISETDSENSELEMPIHKLENVIETKERTESAVMTSITPETTGTRATGVEGGGPYGDITGTSYIEGDTVPYEATTIPGGEESTHYFRWDTNNDGEYEVDHFGKPSEMGINTFDQEYTDNYIGEGTVEMWDGVSMATFSGDGDIWDGAGIYWGLYQGYYATHGIEFKVYEDVTIDQLGMYRYSSYYPNYIYNLRLWTDTGTMLAQVLYPSVPYYSWRWFNIPPVPLDKDETYVVSVGVRYYMGGQDNPGMTADGILEPLNWVYYYYNQWAFPSSTYGSNPLPLVDVHYTYSYEVPLVMTDTISTAVDNSAPVVINAQATGIPGIEGSEVGVTADFWDLGVDDTWEYSIDWGDGTQSPWYSINKYSGGARLLMYTSWSASQDYIAGEIQAELGPFITQLDFYNWYDEGSAADPAFLAQYDVVVVGSNYIPTATLAGEVGDSLAEYVDGGGNVVQMWSSFHTSARVTGRWTDEEYNAIVRGSLYFGTQSLGTVYDPTHPIMDGVSSLTNYYAHNSYAATTYATQLCDYSTGRICTAYNDMNHPNAPDSRIVGIAMFPSSGYVSGDAYHLIGNAIKWASQQGDPELLPMPISLEPLYHVYVDDHPSHVTPLDPIQATVFVRDDDHLLEVSLGGFRTEENFDDWLPSGWTADDWIQSNSNNAGGTAPEAYLLWAYISGSLAQLTSPAFDTTGEPELTLSFRSYIDHFTSTYYCRVFARADATDPWTDYTPWSNPITGNVGPALYTVDLAAEIGTGTQVMFEFSGYYWNIDYWFVDDVILEGLVQWFTYTGLGSDSCEIPIANAYPTAVIPPDLVTICDEKVIFNFEGFQVADNALWEETEEFWYKLRFGDGEETDWIYEGAMEQLDVLLCHWVELSSNNGPDLNPLVDAIMSAPNIGTLDLWNFGAYMEAAAPPLSVMQDYDVIVYASNWAQLNSWWDGVRTDLGDRFADFQDTTGGGVITFMSCYDLSIYYGDLFGLSGWSRYIADDYGAFEQAYYPFGEGSLGTVYDPSHPVMQGVTSLSSSLIYSGDYPLTVGGGGMAAGRNGVLLADWQDGNSAIGVKELQNGARSVNIGQGVYNPGIGQGDINTLMANAIMWAFPGQVNDPTLDTVIHPYGDNGVYTADLMLIDDDMNWKWTMGDGSVQPEYVGPAGEEEMWISHNYIPIEVLNVDPTIQRTIDAYAELDLSIRQSGQKRNSAEMILLENGVQVGYARVDRDPGAPDVAVMHATVHMTKGYEYELYVNYIPEDGDGANPCWIFEGHFPDGKIKELKHTFNSNDPTDLTWDLGSVKALMLGHDITFHAIADDPGSDDLAFIWGWGDCTPHGIHIYENVDPTTAHVGVSDEASLIFNQVAGDPWFDRPLNDERSPAYNPMFVSDTITHVFDESQPYYYFVTLTVLDDDVGDGYPTTYLNGGGYDMEFVEIDFTP